MLDSRNEKSETRQTRLTAPPGRISFFLYIVNGKATNLLVSGQAQEFNSGAVALIS